MKNKNEQTEAAWSPRSQRTLLQENELREKLRKCESIIGHRQRQIAKLEQSKASMMKHSLGDRGPTTFLTDTLRELEDKNRELAAFKEQRTQIQSEIEALAPTPANLAERAERQNFLARLAADRLKKDELADGALKGLRRLLDERQELAAKMRKAAEAAEFTIPDDGLDARRFDDLLALLPESLAEGSARWHAWFTGEQQGLKSYVVVADTLLIPETLARGGFYYFGEKLELADDEAGELLRPVCPLGRARHDVCWTYEPPRIMPAKKFEALLREAGDDLNAAKFQVSQQNKDQEEKLRDDYVVEYSAAVREHRTELRARGLLIGGNPEED